MARNSQPWSRRRDGDGRRICLACGKPVRTAPRECAQPKHHEAHDRKKSAENLRDRRVRGVAAIPRLEKQLAALREALKIGPNEHYSDCAVHNAPALPPGPCNCKPEAP